MSLLKEESESQQMTAVRYNEVDKWRVENLKSLNEHQPSTLLLDVLLVYQGVIGILCKEYMTSDDYFITIVKEMNECKVNCCHILSGVEYQCEISSYFTNWANFNMGLVQAELRGILPRFVFKDGNIFVSETSTMTPIYDIGKISQGSIVPPSNNRPQMRTLGINISGGHDIGASVPSTPTTASSTSLSLNSETLSEIRLTGQIKVRVVTWNMYAQPPPPIHVLREKLLPLKKHHIYVIGSEECENSIAQSVVNPSKAHWEEILSLAVGGSFQMLCAHTLQATHSIVFVHRDLIPLVSEVQSNVVSTGIGLGMGNRLGNKGGVGISFKVANTKFMFINAHLAHAKKGLDRRNEEYHTITAQLARGVVPTLTGSVDEKEAVRSLLNYFDVVVWAGDLNYRLTIDREEADALISVNNIQKLLEFDQLKTSIQNKQVFEGFEEGVISFLPTYKYDIDTDTYDTSKKKRVPSYTDRILYKPSEKINLQEYNTVQELRISDHRPVYANFLVACPIAGAMIPAGQEVTETGMSSSQVCCIS